MTSKLNIIICHTMTSKSNIIIFYNMTNKSNIIICHIMTSNVRFVADVDIRNHYIEMYIRLTNLFVVMMFT